MPVMQVFPVLFRKLLTVWIPERENTELPVLFGIPGKGVFKVSNDRFRLKPR